MVVCAAHIKLSWGGTLGTPAAEVWTNSIAFTGVTDTDSESYDRSSLVDMLPEVQTALTAWHSSSNTMCSPDANLTWIKLNKIGVDGKYIDNPNTIEFDGVPGGLSSNKPIWQQSTVVSFLTGQSRGRGSRGRIYPPACGMPPNSAGYLVPYAAGLQANAVTLIGALNHIQPTVGLFTVVAPRWNACIVSNAVGGKLPLLTPITRVAVDEVPDVQRRRVNRLPVPSVSPTTVYINT